MNPKKPEPNYTRESFARSAQEVPFFPFRSVSMSHIEMDGLELAQFDFVNEAGQPSRPPDVKPAEDE